VQYLNTQASVITTTCFEVIVAGSQKLVDILLLALFSWYEIARLHSS
jgi:hypothetical protein